MLSITASFIIRRILQLFRKRAVNSRDSKSFDETEL